MQVAALFAAVRVCTATLATRSWDAASPQLCFPAASPLNGIHFDFVAHVVRGVYFACTVSGDDAAVKFSSAYGEVAHRALADAGLAPQLLAFERRGTYAVSLTRWHPWPTLSEINDEDIDDGLVDAVRDALERATAVLDKHGLVLGDIRGPNVIVHRNEAAAARSGPWRVMLIDFDWAGPAGHVNFPWRLNTEVEWPDGAPGRAIQADDDRHMCRMLLERLSVRGRANLSARLHETIVA
jgi:hypothetical protein